MFSYTLVGDLTGFIFLRFLAGVTGSAGGVASRTLVRRVIPKGGGRAFGAWYMVIAAGGLIGPIVGGYAATTSYKLAFYIATAIAATAVLLSLGVPGSDDVDEKSKDNTPTKGFDTVEKNTLIVASALIIIPILLQFTFHTFMPVYAKESEKLLLGPFEIGLAFTAMSVVGLFAPLFFGELSDRIGRKKIILLGMALQCVSFSILPLITGITMLSLVAIILGLGNASVGPPMMALLTDKIRPSKLGLAIGLYGGGEDIGILIGPMLIGYVYQNYSAELSFFLAAGLMLTNILISFFLLKRIVD
jgi:MFS family permease